jgi:hypothetical protein
MLKPRIVPQNESMMRPFVGPDWQWRVTRLRMVLLYGRRILAGMVCHDKLMTDLVVSAGQCTTKQGANRPKQATSPGVIRGFAAPKGPTYYLGAPLSENDGKQSWAKPEFAVNAFHVFWIVVCAVCLAREQPREQANFSDPNNCEISKTIGHDSWTIEIRETWHAGSGTRTVIYISRWDKMRA